MGVRVSSRFRHWSVKRCLLVAVLTAIIVGSIAVAAEAVVYRQPVDGRIVDRFREPTNPYGPGNRGWEYSVASGERVRAPADGTVTFSGQVGGVLNVVIQHSDGIRTTLSKLESIDEDVDVGSRIRAGEVIGIASRDFYFGARCGDEYIDPARLFNRRAHLVPLDGGDLSMEKELSVCSD